MKKQDLSGQRFGKLVAIERRLDGKWLCQCDCGHAIAVAIGNLKNGHNRTLSEYDGATSIYDVIYADGQFSCADALTSVAIREPECLTTAYEVVDTVLASTTYVVPEDYMYFSTSQPRTSDFKQIGHHYFR